MSRPVALLAEDDPSLAYLLKFVLSQNGYEVLWFSDGRQALDHIDRTDLPPKVALLDLMMPYVDGHQLVVRIRGKPTWRDVPIIIITAKAGEADLVRAMQQGANEYVSKPFDPDDLVARVDRLAGAAPHGEGGSQ